MQQASAFQGRRIDIPVSADTSNILSIEGGYVQPIGVFSRIASGGYSVSLIGAVNNVGVNNLYVGLKGGFNRFWGKNDVNYSYIVPFTALIGYTFNLPKSFFISPALAAGGSWNYMKKDRLNSKGVIEPIVNPALSIGYKIMPILKIYIITNYNAVFERKVVIQIFSLNVGLAFFL